MTKHKEIRLATKKDDSVANSLPADAVLYLKSVRGSPELFMVTTANGVQQLTFNGDLQAIEPISSSTDNSVALWDGTGGQNLKSSTDLIIDGTTADFALPIEVNSSVGTVASTGDIRLPFPAAIYGKNGGGADMLIMQIDGSNNIVFGDTTNSNGAFLSGNNSVNLRVAAATKISADGSVVSLADPVEVNTNGGTVASAGGIRLANSTGGYIYFANNAGDGNVRGLACDTSDNIIVGDASNTNSLFADVVTGGSLNFRVNSISSLTVGASFVNARKPLQANSDAGAVASTGAVRIPNNSGLYARNSLNNSDLTLARVDGADNLYYGATVPGQVNVYIQAPANREVRIDANAEQVIEFAGGVGTGVVADAGEIRVRSGFTLNARNNAQDNNLQLLTASASDNIVLGSTANAANVFIDAGSGRSLTVRPNGAATSSFQFTGSNFIVGSASIVFSGSTTNSTITQTTISGAATDMNVLAQSSTGSTGGNLILSAGFGTTNGLTIIEDGDGYELVAFGPQETTPVAASGTIRIASNAQISARNKDDDGDITLIQIDVNDTLRVGAGGAGGFQVDAQGAFNVNSNGFTFINTSVQPTIAQSSNTANGATGRTMDIHAQDATGTTSTGGDLHLRPGSGTSEDGYLELQDGQGIPRFTIDPDGHSVFVGNNDVRINSQLRFTEIGADPINDPHTGFLYTKDDTGVTQLFYEDSDGSVTQITTVDGGSAVTGTGTDNTIARWDGTSSIQSSGVSIDDSDNVSGANTISIGAIPATSGSIRLPSSASVRTLKTDDTTVVTAWEMSGDTLVVGGTSSAANTQIRGTSTVDIYIGSDEKFQVGSSGVDTRVTLGVNTDAGTVATTGDLRLRNTGSVESRNNAGNGNLDVIKTDSSDNIIVGSSNSTTVAIKAATNLALQGGLDTIFFQDSAVTPRIVQSNETSAGVSGDTFTIHAQDSTGTGTKSGGDLFLRAGNASGGTDTGGNVTLQAGNGDSLGEVRLNAGDGTRIAIMDSSQIEMRVGLLEFDTAVSTPTLQQENTSETGVSGDTFTIHAQDSNGTGTKSGGDLFLRGGSASGGTDTGGDLILQTGSGDGGSHGSIRLRDASANTVVRIPGDGSFVEFQTDLLQFHIDEVTPTIRQQDETGSGVSGETFTIHSQDHTATSGTNVAGNFIIRAGDSSGSGATQNDGGVLSLVGGTATGATTNNGGDVLITAGNGATSAGNVSLRSADNTTRIQVRSDDTCLIGGSGVNTSFFAAASNYQSMSGGMFIGNASAEPTGNPTSGGFLFVDGGALKWRGSSGTITTIAPA